MDEFSSLANRGYRLGERIGAGGFGAVYRGYETAVARDVAIKIILPQHASNPEFIKRFDVEAQVVARLEHIHIVPLYAFWREPEGHAFLVMRWLPGNLQTSINSHPWSTDAAARLLEQMAEALQFAHNQGVVHRDIKPDNILLDKELNGYLADFGLAKVLAATTSITDSGKWYGSLPYSSPEQWKEQPVTPQTDIYSLGLVMFELLTGKKAYQGSSPEALMKMHLDDPLPPLNTFRPALPHALQQVLQRASAKRPWDRYQNALEMARDFRRAVEPSVSVQSTFSKSVEGPANPLPADAEESTIVVSSGLPSQVRREAWPRLVELVRRETALRSRRIYLMLFTLFLIAVGAVLWVSRPRSVLQITVATNPLARQWIESQASAFWTKQKLVNDQVVRIQVSEQDGMAVWLGKSGWTTTEHPDAWLSESSAIVNYATTIGLHYRIIDNRIVSTPLVWGIYQQRANTLTQAVDWPALKNVQQPWGAAKPAFALPCKSQSGFSTLLSGAASYYQQSDLTTQDLTDGTFQTWIQPLILAVPNFAPFGQHPAQQLATNGMSIADFALLPESEWLVNFTSIDKRQPMVFAYPAYRFDFDMPLALWDGAETSQSVQEAVKEFEVFLKTDPDAQQSAANLGLRPTNFILTTSSAPLFANASKAGITLTTPPGQLITPPTQRDVLSLANWLKSFLRSC